MRMKRKFVFLSSGATIAAILGAICVLALSSCGNHRRHHRHHTAALTPAPIEADEFIGTLGVCWPAIWSDEQRAFARTGILAHLTAWETEFAITIAPAKLIIFLSADGGGVSGDGPMILIHPGECFDFPSLFNLLTHHHLGDPQELDARWEGWNALGDAVADDLRQLCVVSPVPEPDSEPTSEEDHDAHHGHHDED